MYRSIAPSLHPIVFVGELLVETIAERHDVGGICPQSEKTTGFP
jgi:hypothetical protein